jgi:hypothetical protein
MRLRSLLPLALALVIVALPVARATAGTMTLSYTLAGGSVDLSGPHVSPTAGSATFVLTAFRFTPLASSGSIVGGSISGLVLKGVDAGVGAFQFWTYGSGFAGGPPGPLPIPLTGFFSGLNAAGTAFTAGGFGAKASIPKGTPFVTHGVFGMRPIYGSGSVMLFGSVGGGTGSHCWNGFGVPPGACTAFTPLTPPVSMLAAVTGPGFNVAGAEVGRVVAMEPIPEPATALLLGLGLASLATIVSRYRG